MRDRSRVGPPRLAKGDPPERSPYSAGSHSPVQPGGSYTQ